MSIFISTLYPITKGKIYPISYALIIILISCFFKAYYFHESHCLFHSISNNSQVQPKITKQEVENILKSKDVSENKKLSFEPVKCDSPDQENLEYSEIFREVIFDHELSLKWKMNNAREKEKNFLMGNGDKLIIEVLKSDEVDKDTKREINQAPLFFYGLKSVTKEMVIQKCILSHKIIEFQTENNTLYEFIFIRPRTEKDSYTIVNYQAVLESVQNPPQINLEWLQNFSSKATQFYDQSALIFMDSLEDWGTIEKSIKKYESHKKAQIFYSAFELTVLTLVYIGEIIYLRNLLTSNIIII